MRRRGLTLLELLVVLVILISLATIVVPVIGTFGRKSQQVATRENLLQLQDLLMNRYMADMGELPRPGTAGIAAGRPNHPQLRYLFVNPDNEDIAPTSGATLLSSRHWQAPYVRHAGARYRLDTANNFTTAYGLADVMTTDTPPVISVPGDPTVLDAWGRPIVIQEPSTHGELTPDATDKTYARLVSAGANGKIDTSPTVRMPNAAQRGDDVVIFLFRHDEYGEDFLKLEQ
jgi:prepilin-type N-terminal cleavage/methylation domain-containing protein